jgi:Zn-dependent peptidase ImmA (M78 family)
MAVAVMEGGPEAFALYDKDTDNIVVVLPERTYLALEQGHHRARFSLCHEIGHVVLHPELLKRFARLPHRQAALQRGAWSDHPVCFDTEWQANAFAAALLMPAKGLAELEERGRLNPSAISTQFQVSTDAAQRRLATYLSRKTELLASV